MQSQFSSVFEGECDTSGSDTDLISPGYPRPWNHIIGSASQQDQEVNLNAESHSSFLRKGECHHSGIETNLIHLGHPNPWHHILGSAP